MSATARRRVEMQVVRTDGTGFVTWVRIPESTPEADIAFIAEETLRRELEQERETVRSVSTIYVEPLSDDL